MQQKFILISLFLLSGLLLVGEVSAGINDNVSGYAWSENIGWIGFNCTNQNSCSSSNYGVNIAKDGPFSGYAWSENIGWITFNKSELSGCPSGACETKMDKKTGQVSGWAKALAASDGWDGWIHLMGSNYGVSISKITAEFSGWAWGDAVVGWLSFNCSNQGVCAASDYKVMTSSKLFNQPPIASISCDASACNSTGCVAYTGCPFKLVNQSTDPDGQNDINKSEWDIINWGSAPDITCAAPNALCDFTPQTQILGSGSFTANLYVQDKSGASNTITQGFTIRQEAIADFKCSLDNASWQSCSTVKPAVKETVYFLDQSTWSEGASVITSRSWTFQDGNPASNTGNNTNPSTKFQSGGSKQVTLTIQDNQGRTNSQSHTLSAKTPFPEFKEIPPIFRLKQFLAQINSFFNIFAF